MKLTKYLLIFSLLSLCSCNQKENTESKTESTAKNTTAAITEQITTETAEITTAATEETTPVPVTPAIKDVDNDEYNRRFDAIKIFYKEYYGSFYDEPYKVFNGYEHITYNTEVDFFMDNVSRVENTHLGKITDEQDLISKSRDVFIQVRGQEFIDRVEAEFAERDGEKLRITERQSPIYDVEYYDAADIWYIYPDMPRGVLEDGSLYEPLYEFGSFLLVRGSDGEVIGSRF